MKYYHYLKNNATFITCSIIAIGAAIIMSIIISSKEKNEMLRSVQPGHILTSHYSTDPFIFTYQELTEMHSRIDDVWIQMVILHDELNKKCSCTGNITKK